MRSTEKVVLFVVLLIPLLVATLGWPMLVDLIAGPSPQPTLEAPGAAATSVAAARTGQPTARPTLGAPPTLDPAATPQATSAARAPTSAPVAAARPTSAPPPPPPPPLPTPTAAPARTSATAPNPAPPQTVASARNPAPPPVAPNPAPPSTAAPPRPAANPAPGGDPGQTVSSFYNLVSSHQFDTAAQLWSPHMLSAFPPQQNIYQRFSSTQAIRLQRADVVSQDQSRATVAVDLVESDAQAGQRHFVGTWYLVRGPGGWMLDQPDLRPAP